MFYPSVSVIPPLFRLLCSVYVCSRYGFLHVVLLYLIVYWMHVSLAAMICCQ